MEYLLFICFWKQTEGVRKQTVKIFRPTWAVYRTEYQGSFWV